MISQNHNRYEILAPLGKFDYLEKIIDSGAGAVYAGLSGVSSRPADADLTTQQLKEAIYLAHERNVRVHIAVNGCISEKQIDWILEQIQILDEFGADAVILADYGLVKKVSMYVHNMEIHASTLLGVYNTPTIQYLKNIGVSRIVLSTELFLNEISKLIDANSEMDFELVADGGICFNSNRICNLPHTNTGKDYQVFCQMPYDLYYHGEYLGVAKKIGSENLKLSYTIGLYMALGINSFKLEGRTNEINYICRRISQMKENIKMYSGHEKEFLNYLHYVDRYKGK